MPFNGREGKTISMGVAKKWVKNWRDANPGKTEAIFFGKEKLKELLDEPESVGIRFYFAINDDNEYRLVLIGAKENEDNILPSEEGKDGVSGPMDDGKPCPPNCPSNPI